MYAGFDCIYKAAICTVSDSDAWGALTLWCNCIYALVISTEAIIAVYSLHALRQME